MPHIGKNPSTVFATKSISVDEIGNIGIPIHKFSADARNFTVDLFNDTSDITADGDRTSFVVSGDIDSSGKGLMVFVNGGYKISGVDYTIDSTNIIVFDTAPDNEANIVVLQLGYKQALNAYTILAGSINTSHLAPDSFTTEKIYDKAITNDKLYGEIDTTKLADFLDEDDLISDDSTGIPSQQSVKAYLDNIDKLIISTKNNIMINAFDISIALGLNTYNLNDGIIDSFESEDGIDIADSTGYTFYDSDRPHYIEPNLDTTRENIRLVSAEYSADIEPDIIYISLMREDVDEIIEGTDFIVFVSRDGGLTYSECTLTNQGYHYDSNKILTGVVDMSLQATGTTIKYKINTHNNKDIKIYSVGLLWR